MRTAKVNRRYRLHQKLKNAGIKYSAVCKTIYMPWDFEELKEDIQELQNDHGYQIQTEII